MNHDINSRASVTVLMALGALAAAILMMAPAFVGAYITLLGFSPQQAGYLISADMAGMGLASLPAMWWINRLNWRQVTRAALLVMVAGNLLSASQDSFSLILITRFFTGLASGTIMSICLASIGLTRDPDRVFGLWIVAQLITGAVGFALFPHILALGGLPSIFIILAAVVLSLSFFVRHLPVSGAGAKAAAAQGPAAIIKYRLALAACGILGVLCFYIGQSCIWAFLGRIGIAYQLDSEFVSYALSLSSLAGIAGALSASALSGRWGRLLPAVAGFGIILLSLALLLNRLPNAGYMLATCLFQFSLAYTLPYLLGSITAIDSTGRIILLANIMIGGGLAIGPAIAGSMIGSGGYQPVIWLGLAFMSLCFVFFLPLVTRRIPRVVPAV